MKTAYTIFLDYVNATKQADKLDHVAASIRSEVDRLNECRSGISAAWKGESASAYLQKMEKVITEYSRAADNLSKAASTIRGIAKGIYSAEKKALDIANTRTM